MIHEQMDQLSSELEQLLTVEGAEPLKRKLAPETRAKIAATQKKNWAARTSSALPPKAAPSKRAAVTA